MPLDAKAQATLAAMKKEYGVKKGEEVFYASVNAGKINEDKKCPLTEAVKKYGRKRN